MDELRERVARGIWDRSGNYPAWDDLPEGGVSRRWHFELADAVIEALGLVEQREDWFLREDTEIRRYVTPWERIEEDG